LLELTSHDLIDFVDGFEPCPSKFIVDHEHGNDTSFINPKFVTWVKKDLFVLIWIKYTLTESILGTVYGLKKAQQAWNSLAARFASQSRS
jgi:hypothetical protein